jgi:hypothetical protein
MNSNSQKPQQFDLEPGDFDGFDYARPPTTEHTIRQSCRTLIGDRNMLTAETVSVLEVHSVRLNGSIVEVTSGSPETLACYLQFADATSADKAWRLLSTSLVGIDPR